MEIGEWKSKKIGRIIKYNEYELIWGEFRR